VNASVKASSGCKPYSLTSIRIFRVCWGVDFNHVCDNVVSSFINIRYDVLNRQHFHDVLDHVVTRLISDDNLVTYSVLRRYDNVCHVVLISLQGLVETLFGSHHRSLQTVNQLNYGLDLGNLSMEVTAVSFGFS